MPIEQNTLSRFITHLGSGFVCIFAENDEHNTKLQAGLCSFGLRYWKLQTSISECFFLVAKQDNNVCLDYIVQRVGYLSNVINLDFTLIKPEEITEYLFFEIFQHKQNTTTKKTDLKLYFESPSSSLEAQCFHLNKQCWLT